MGQIRWKSFLKISVYHGNGDHPVFPGAPFLRQYAKVVANWLNGLDISMEINFQTFQKNECAKHEHNVKSFGCDPLPKIAVIHTLSVNAFTKGPYGNHSFYAYQLLFAHKLTHFWATAQWAWFFHRLRAAERFEKFLNILFPIWFLSRAFRVVAHSNDDHTYLCMFQVIQTYTTL